MGHENDIGKKITYTPYTLHSSIGDKITDVRHVAEPMECITIRLKIQTFPIMWPSTSSVTPTRSNGQDMSNTLLHEIKSIRLYLGRLYYWEGDTLL